MSSVKGPLWRDGYVSGTVRGEKVVDRDPVHQYVDLVPVGGVDRDPYPSPDE